MVPSSNKVLAVAFLLSGTCHLSLALVTGSFFAAAPKKEASHEILISLEDAPRPSKASVASKASAPQKKYPGVSKKTAQPIPVEASKIQKMAPLQASAQKQVAFASVPSSAQLLNDPAKGKIFSRYFSKIKQRIYQTVQDQYETDKMGKGQVSLIFIVQNAGLVEDVYILDKDTSAPERARRFAVYSVRQSAPFGPFPPELQVPRICFNLTLVFDDF